MNKVFGLTKSLITLIFFFCALLVFLIWNQIRIQVASDREESIAAALQRNSNLAVSLEQYAIRTIKTSDAFLQMVKMEYEKNSSKIDFNGLLNKEIIDKKFISHLAIVDEKGKVIYSDLSGFNGGSPDLSHQEHFYFHKTRKDELFISKPIFSKTIGKTVIVLSRRIDLPDGRFGGTVAVQLEPSTFTKFYSSANLGDNDIISLISPDGITYARRTGKKESYGENISRSPLFRYVAQNPINSYFAKDALKGIPTYFSYRKLENYPVIATVGTAEKDVLAAYKGRTKRDYVFGSILTILLLLFPFLMSMILIQRKKVFKKIRISENRYRSIFENNQDAYLVVYPDGRLKALNRAAMKLFFLPDLPFSGQPFTVLYKNSIPSIQLNNDKVIHTGSCKEEIIFIRHDDSQFTGEVAYSGYKDYGGNQQRVIMIRDISFRKEMQEKLVLEQKKHERNLTKQIILAQEREREAIGHEMHDNVNQVLTTVKLYLELAIHKPEMREELIPRCIEHILICITEIRNLSRELSAPTLGTQSLMDSVNSLIEMVSTASGMKIHFDSLGYLTSIIKDQKLAIYRILQEQLNNIIKHAAATEVCIGLNQHGGNTVLTIKDNGVGFDLSAKRKGIGLNNILSRTKVFGGELIIESSPGNGTLLKVILPIQVNVNDKKTSVENEVSIVADSGLTELDQYSSLG